MYLAWQIRAKSDHCLIYLLFTFAINERTAVGLRTWPLLWEGKASAKSRIEVGKEGSSKKYFKADWLLGDQHYADVTSLRIFDA